jgi:hypothetical protein
MKFNHLFKALGITLLLAGNAYSMLQQSHPVNIEFGAIDNKSSKSINLEQIDLNSNKASLIKKIAAKTMTDIALPIFEDAPFSSETLKEKYKVINDSNNKELLAELTLDKQAGTLKGKLFKNNPDRPIDEALLNLNAAQKSKIYVVLRILDNNYEKSKIELSTDRPKVEVEKKVYNVKSTERMRAKDPVPTFYIPGLFRW